MDVFAVTDIVDLIPNWHRRIAFKKEFTKHRYVFWNMLDDLPDMWGGHLERIAVAEIRVGIADGGTQSVHSDFTESNRRHYCFMLKND